ncbi:MAG: HlyD family efflux transporter periplasmic adaptor subunit [Rhodoferax sp.]|uniref:efflux RND transporter periplasmic adaptor subunit n=1 Tax=Rhodoferax sp. TaxID=50421 RepID=UPI00140124B5|nr:HlyD family efflux transporter periplasmic adaptor subunit [Rhodoferax sp.]NDP37432.1 HlyD family efflux transporter periplasmic adaptor subunit [Rhodoferax sp.]
MKTNVQWRRRTVWGLLALLIAWGLFQGFRPQAVEVDVGSASRAALRVVLEQEGRTRVLDRYVVTAPVAGYARRIRLDVGQSVERGALLAELEPVRAEALDPRRRAEAQARIAAAESGVSATEQRSKAAASSADLAQAELQRVRALRLQGHVSAAAEDRAASEAQRSAAELRSAQFAVASARHELEAARTTLRFAGSASSNERVAVRSPVAGRVLKVAHKSEGTVSNGQPLVEIGNPGALEVEVDLLSADAVRIHPGTRVVFERWGGEGVLEGVVRVIEPAGFTKVSALGVEEQRVWVIVAFTSPASQWQRLGDGYRVEASFIVWEGQDILQIPASALFRDGDGWAVFVLEHGKAVKRGVEVGQRTGLSAQVVSGIQSGERVINHPDDRVREGVSVAAR